MGLHRQLVLGSSSKPRQALLERLKLPFKVAEPNIDESPLENEAAEALVLRLAKEKALAVAKHFPDALIIAADQVGILGQQILGKPLCYENAVKQLQKSSGKTLAFYIGLCLYDSKNQDFQLSLEKFDVLYRPLSLEMIENYLKKEQPYQAAGSCYAEGLGISLIEEFHGKDFTALIGLPLIALTRMLEKAGLGPLA